MNGQDLKQRREKLGLTQTALAEIWQVSQITISKWEGNKIGIGQPVIMDFALSFMENTFAEIEPPKLLREVSKDIPDIAKSNMSKPHIAKENITQVNNAPEPVDFLGESFSQPDENYIEDVVVEYDKPQNSKVF